MKETIATRVEQMNEIDHLLFKSVDLPKFEIVSSKRNKKLSSTFLTQSNAESKYVMMIEKKYGWSSLERLQTLMQQVLPS